MSSLSATTLVRLLCLAFLLIQAFTSTLVHGLRLPSGRQISSYTVRGALPPSLRDTPHLPSRLYEVSGDNLLGPDGFSLSLSPPFATSRTVRWHPSLNVTVNGKQFPQSRRPSNLRIVSSRTHNLHVLLSGSPSRPLRVWGSTSPPDSDSDSNADSNLNFNLHRVAPNSPALVDVRDDEDIVLFSTHAPRLLPVFNTLGTNDEQDKHASTSHFSPHTSTNRKTSSSPCTPASRHVVEVAVVFDSTFCALLQSDEVSTLGLVQSLFDEANVFFISDTCVEIALINVEGYCSPGSDPFSFIFNGLAANGVSGIVLDRFIQFHSATRQNVDRDVAYLFSAHSFTGRSFWGVANTPSTCSKSSSYGVLNGPSGPVFAHEVGHNLNCWHTSRGLMRERGADELYFAADSVRNITNYVNEGLPESGASSSCLSPGAPTCDSSCPSRACSTRGGKCIAPVQPPAGFASCKRNNGFANTNKVVRCAELVDIGNGPDWFFYREMNCPSDTQFAEVPFNASDPTILCCAAAGQRYVDGVPADSSIVIRFTITGSGGGVWTNVIVPAGGNDPRSVEPIQFRLFRTASLTCSGGGDNSGSDPDEDENDNSNSNVPSSPPVATPPASPSAVVQLSPQTGATTCGEALPDTEDFFCRRVGRGTFRLTGIGRVKLKVYVRFGRLLLELKSKGKNRTIEGLRLSVNLAAENTFTYNRVRAVTETYSTTLRNLPLRRNSASCCGSGGAEVRMGLRLCKGNKCATGTGSFGVNIWCKNVCSTTQAASGGRAVMMGAGQKCPACVTA